eukprot:258021-Rhodomonas_salina.3
MQIAKAYLAYFEAPMQHTYPPPMLAAQPATPLVSLPIIPTEEIPAILLTAANAWSVPEIV